MWKGAGSADFRYAARGARAPRNQKPKGKAMKQKYLAEVRDADGQLDFRKEEELRKVHPFLFGRSEFTQDNLTWWASYGEGRNQPSTFAEARKFLACLGVSIRPKTWLQGEK